jgi:YfiR/HmsC-like
MNSFSAIRLPHWVRLLCFTLLLYLLATPHLQAAKLEEYQLKAAFLYNFSHFISWPQPKGIKPKRTKPHTVFHYCVMNSGQVENTLRELIGQQPSDQRVLSYKLVTDIDQLDECQLLFISKRQPPQRIDDIVHRLVDKNVLTVSDSDHFAVEGGMVEIARKKNRIRVVINNDVILQKGFKVSSKLLRFVTVVSSDNGGTKE